MTELLRKEDPIILHLACHRQGNMLGLFGTKVEADLLVQYIGQWAAEGKRLQLIIANVCAGADIAQNLSNHGVLAIGPKLAVNDAEATHFSKAFYGHLGAGDSLDLAFKAGKLIAKVYCLFGRKNAAAFRVIHTHA